jgi:hypothetical protein
LKRWTVRVYRVGARLALLGLAGLGSAGCADATKSPTAVKLRTLADFYGGYAVQNKGRGPAGEAEFKKYIAGRHAYELQAKNVDAGNLDALFVSDRDQQPFVVLYGTELSVSGGGKAPLLAYEQAGSGGRRLVVFTTTKVEEVGEPALEQLRPRGP